MLRFIQGTASTEDRARGFLDEMKKAGFDVVADAYIEDGTVAGARRPPPTCSKASSTTASWRSTASSPAISRRRSAWRPRSTTCARAASRRDAVFVGFDSSPRLVEELQNGNIDALIVQSPKKMGRLAVETLVKHLRKQPVEPFIDTGVQVVTAERLKNEPEIRELVGLPKGQ